jgi:hypothetical protein
MAKKVEAIQAKMAAKKSQEDTKIISGLAGKAFNDLLKLCEEQADLGFEYLLLDNGNLADLFQIQAPAVYSLKEKLKVRLEEEGFMMTAHSSNVSVISWAILPE